MRIIESKADQEKFLAWAGEELYNRFLKQKQRLSGQETDMYYWMKKTPEDLDTRLSELENTPTRSQKSSTASEGARIVYKDDNWTIRQIDTFEASAKYGKGTKWCITGADDWGGVEKGRGYFDDYFNKGVRFLFFESREPIDGMHKWAVASLYNGNYEIYNEVDKGVRKIPNLPNITNLNIVQDGFARYSDKSGVKYIALNDSTLLYDDLTIQHCFREDWRAEDANNYESSDVKKYLESGDFARDASIAISYDDIFLLSIKEAKQLPKEVLRYRHGWWWLRSPGLLQDGAAHVYYDGSVAYYGCNVRNDRGCVRPAFKISESEMQKLSYIGDVTDVKFTPENVIKR